MVRFADGFHTYTLRVDWRGEGERVPVGSAADARRLLSTARSDHPGDGARQLRGLLSEIEPVPLLARLSDGDVRARVAQHLAAGRATAWRTPAPTWGRADATAPTPAEEAPQEPSPPTPSPSDAAPDAAAEEPSCRQAWAEIDAEAAAVLARGGDANPIERNRHITAAYARYYQRTQAAGVDNPWGGVAAIVSGQAGCSMIYADEMIAAGEDFDRAGDIGPGPGALFEAAGLGYQEVGELVKDALADTNRYIFEDIYPVLRMHEEHGMRGIERCGPVRPGPSGPVPQDMRNALALIEQGGTGNVREAGRLMARYEQSTIVQDKILDDFWTRKAFQTNQWAANHEWGRALGARKPELALTAECPPYPSGTEAVPFQGSFIETQNRVRYYQDLARAFGRMPAADKARTLGTLARRGL